MQSLIDNLQQLAAMYPKHDVLDNTDTIEDAAVPTTIDDQRMPTPSEGTEGDH